MFLLLTFFLNNLIVLEQIYVKRIIVKIEQSSLYPVQSFKIFSFHPHPRSRPLLSASAPRVGAGPGSLGAAWGLQPNPAPRGRPPPPSTTGSGAKPPKAPQALAPPRGAPTPRRRGSSGSGARARRDQGAGRLRAWDRPRLRAPPPRAGSRSQSILSLKTSRSQRRVGATHLYPRCTYARPGVSTAHAGRRPGRSALPAASGPRPHSLPPHRALVAALPPARRARAREDVRGARAPPPPPPPQSRTEPRGVGLEGDGPDRPPRGHGSRSSCRRRRRLGLLVVMRSGLGERAAALGRATETLEARTWVGACPGDSGRVVCVDFPSFFFFLPFLALASRKVGGFCFSFWKRH